MTSGGSLKIAFAGLARNEVSSREVREVEDNPLMSEESTSSGVSSG